MVKEKRVLCWWKFASVKIYLIEVRSGELGKAEGKDKRSLIFTSIKSFIFDRIFLVLVFKNNVCKMSIQTKMNEIN